MAPLYNPPPEAAGNDPPAIANASAKGLAARFAREDHTHALNLRKARIQTAADGAIEYAFSPAFAPGVAPYISVAPETTAGDTDNLNVQVDGAPTNISVKLRVKRTAIAQLLGIDVVVPVSVPGATWLHIVALA